MIATTHDDDDAAARHGWLLLTFDHNWADEIDCRAVAVVREAAWRAQQAALRAAHTGPFEASAGGEVSHRYVSADEYLAMFREHPVGDGPAAELAALLGEGTALGPLLRPDDVPVLAADPTGDGRPSRVTIPRCHTWLAVVHRGRWGDVPTGSLWVVPRRTWSAYVAAARTRGALDRGGVQVWVGSNEDVWHPSVDEWLATYEACPITDTLARTLLAELGADVPARDPVTDRRTWTRLARVGLAQEHLWADGLLEAHAPRVPVPPCWAHGNPIGACPVCGVDTPGTAEPFPGPDPDLARLGPTALGGCKAWTDHPAPEREVKVLSYDGDKRCVVRVGPRLEVEVKAEHLRAAPGGPPISPMHLASLPRTRSSR